MKNSRPYTKKDFYMALVLLGILVAMYAVSISGIAIYGDAAIGIICLCVYLFGPFVLFPIGIYMCLERYLGAKQWKGWDTPGLDEPHSEGKAFVAMGITSAVNFCFGPPWQYFGIMLLGGMVIFVCVEKTLYRKMWPGWDEACTGGKLLIVLSLTATICFGAGLFADVRYMAVCFAYYGSAEGFGHCVAVWAVVVLGWLLGLAWGIRQMWKVDACSREKKGWAAFAASLLLIAGLLMATEVCNTYIADFLEEEIKAQYYEQHGEDALPYEIYLKMHE